MAKSRKQILQELLELENENLGALEEPQKQEDKLVEKSEPINAVETIDNTPILKAKKPRTQKQQEAFEKAKAIRDANALKRKEEQKKKEDEERRIAEEKIVKKAIAIKKKQIKKQAVLDEVSDDETPIEKIKEIAMTKADKVPVKDVALVKTELPKLPNGLAQGFAKINFF